MAASIVALNAVSTASFGVTAETGILIENISKSVSSEKLEKQDNDGDTVLVAYFDKRATFGIDGVLLGVTGIGAAVIATAITSANSGIGGVGGGGGVTTGTIYVDTVDYNGVNKDFVNISISATQYPGIV